ASAFPKFLDAFFAWYYQTFPVNATFIGVHDYDDRLPDYSERGIGAALAAIDTLLARVRVFRHTTLHVRQELERRLVEGFLEMRRQMPFARSRSTWRPHFPTALPARAPVDPRRWTCSCGRATSSAPPLGRSRRWPKTASPRRTPRWRHTPARWARGHGVRR